MAKNNEDQRLVSEIQQSLEYRTSVTPLTEWMGELWVTVSIAPNREVKLVSGNSLNASRIVYVWVTIHPQFPFFLKKMSRRRADFWSERISSYKEICLTWGNLSVCPCDIIPQWLFETEDPFSVKVVQNPSCKSWRVLDVQRHGLVRDPDAN